jgi:hypothetical protein
MDMTRIGAMPDFSAIALSCSSMTARAGRRLAVVTARSPYLRL